jgi:hypothetical protein
VKERAMDAIGQKALKARRARMAVAADLFWREADAMHALPIKRADELMGCTEGSPEEEELRALSEAIDAYEAKRWPSGKVAGGKG